MNEKNFFGVKEWNKHSALEIALNTKFAIVKVDETSVLIGGFDITPEGFCMGFGFKVSDVGFEVVEVTPLQNVAIEPKTLFEPEFTAVIIPAPAFLQFMVNMRQMKPIENFGEAIANSFSMN